MELDTFDGEFAMAEGHDRLAIGGASRDFKLAWEVSVFNDERVVAGAGHRKGNVGEDGFAIMVDFARLPVHQPGSADDVTAKGCTDRLVTETYTKDRNLRAARRAEGGEVLDEVDADAGILWGAGTWGDEDPVGMQRFDFGWCELVIAANDHLGTQLAHVLDQVVGKGVVVVQDEDHGELLCQFSGCSLRMLPTNLKAFPSEYNG